MATQVRSSRWAASLLLAAGLALLQTSAQAQPQTGPDPRLQAGMRAFDALPDVERKVIQADLIWTGHLNSAATGSYGPLTFRAVNAFKGAQAAPDGQLAPSERQALARAARSAREAAGFGVLVDERSGVRIGIPQKLLPKREANSSGGSRWQSADGKVTLDVTASPAGEPLPALFERATAPNPNIQRRITYRLLRPDFFVVAGETPTGKFYRRLAAGPAGLRGFSIGYDKALAASFDRVVTAIADSFEPFPSGDTPKPEAPRPDLLARPEPPRVSSERFGTGLVVAKDLVLSVPSAVEGCRDLKAGGRAARLRLRDQSSGLVLLDVPGLAAAKAPGLRDGARQPGEAVVVLAFAGMDGARAAVALPGDITASGVSTPLQPGNAGSPVFDRQGRLIGLMTADPPAGGLVAGVAPQRRLGVTADGALAAMLARAEVNLAPSPSGANLTTGAIVDNAGKAVVSIACTP